MLISRLYNFKNRAKKMTFIMRLNDFFLFFSFFSFLISKYNFVTYYNLRFRNENATYLSYFLDVHCSNFHFKIFKSFSIDYIL